MLLTPYPHTNAARNQLRKRSSPCLRDLLLPLFPSPRRSRAVLNSPYLLLLLLFLLPRQTFFEEVAEGGAVNCLTAITIETMTLLRGTGEATYPTMPALSPPCGSSSVRTPGRAPVALAVFCARGPSCSPPSTFWRLWWRFSARAIATVIRSCLAHERSRRSLRRFAAPTRSHSRARPLRFS